jgi:hypothetical protein
MPPGLTLDAVNRLARARATVRAAVMLDYEVALGAQRSFTSVKGGIVRFSGSRQRLGVCSLLSSPRSGSYGGGDSYALSDERRPGSERSERAPKATGPELLPFP